jgi:NADPH2:quinone reductase
MRALIVRTAGEQPTLSEIPTPEVVSGTVLIKVKAAGLNPLDNAIAGGVVAQMGFPHEYPVVIGRDVAGVVVAIGEGVTQVAVGDEVLGHIVFLPPIQLGTIAEYALLAAESVIAKPAGLSFVQAAALPLASGAATRAIDAVEAGAGDRVLVVGASGGVGSYVVQLLAARGATVIATGTAADTERLTRLGADQVVDHTAGPVSEQVLASYPDGVDALIEMVSHDLDGLLVNAAAVRPGGRVTSTINIIVEERLAERQLTGTNLGLTHPTRDSMHPLAERAAAGKLTVDVGQVLSLDDAASGLATIASGRATGKIVIELTD